MGAFVLAQLLDVQPFTYDPLEQTTRLDLCKMKCPISGCNAKRQLPRYFKFHFATDHSEDASIYLEIEHEKVCPLNPKCKKRHCNFSEKGCKVTSDDENKKQSHCKECKFHPKNIGDNNQLCRYSPLGCLAWFKVARDAQRHADFACEFNTSNKEKLFLYLWRLPKKLFQSNFKRPARKMVL